MACVGSHCAVVLLLNSDRGMLVRKFKRRMCSCHILSASLHLQLDDGILQEIGRSPATVPLLDESRQILKRLAKRDLYKVPMPVHILEIVT